ncbi:MAG: GNAT family N-acetyltransferase [Bacteroidia bacterium]
MNPDKRDIKVSLFRPEWRLYFDSINREWLGEYYQITSADEEILADPEKIVANGGMVFFVTDHDTVIGTCALEKVNEKEFLLIKMGVLKSRRSTGAGRLMMKACVDFAKGRGAEVIILETAEELIPAIRLYESFGFRRTSEIYVHPEFGRKIFEMRLQLNAR